MNVSVVIPTRGNVDMTPIVEGPWPGNFVEVNVWDNSQREDFGVMARYKAIEQCRGDLIFTQDDDVLVPLETARALVEAWVVSAPLRRNHVICNMPREFRAHYSDSALVGFGSVFHRDAPRVAFERFSVWAFEAALLHGAALLQRTADVIFTALSPLVTLDLPKENLPYAYGPDRMYRSAEHVGERARMLELARRCRDGR